MHSRGVSLVLLSLVGCQALPTSGPIEGVVLDADGAPLAGVAIGRYAPNGVRETTLQAATWQVIAFADARGRFTLDGPLGEPVDLRLTGDHEERHADGSVTTIIGAASSTYGASSSSYRGELCRVVAPAHDVVLRARGLRTLSVTVLDGNGLPASGATVRVDPKPWTIDSIATDIEGHAWLTQLPDNEVAVTAYPCERSSSPWIAAKTVHVTPNDQSIELRLRRSVVLSGIVLDPDGTPVRGDCIRTSAPDEAAVGAVSDASGRFRLMVAPGVSYGVDVDHVAERGLSTTVKGVSADGPELVIRLGP